MEQHRVIAEFGAPYAFRGAKSDIKQRQGDGSTESVLGIPTYLGEL